MKKILLCLCLLVGYGMAQDKNNTKFVIPLQLEKITEQDTQVSPDTLDELNVQRARRKWNLAPGAQESAENEIKSAQATIDAKIEQAKLNYAEALDRELLQEARRLDAISLEELKLSNSYKKQRYNAQIELVGEKQKILTEIAISQKYIANEGLEDITTNYDKKADEALRNQFITNDTSVLDSK